MRSTHNRLIGWKFSHFPQCLLTKQSVKFHREYSINCFYLRLLRTVSGCLFSLFCFAIETLEMRWEFLNYSSSGVAGKNLFTHSHSQFSILYFTSKQEELHMSCVLFNLTVRVCEHFFCSSFCGSFPPMLVRLNRCLTRHECVSRRFTKKSRFCVCLNGNV